MRAFKSDFRNWLSCNFSASLDRINCRFSLPRVWAEWTIAWCRCCLAAMGDWRVLIGDESRVHGRTKVFAQQLHREKNVNLRAKSDSCFRYLRNLETLDSMRFFCVVLLRSVFSILLPSAKVVSSQLGKLFIVRQSRRNNFPLQGWWKLADENILNCYGEQKHSQSPLFLCRLGFQFHNKRSFFCLLL